MSTATTPASALKAAEETHRAALAEHAQAEKACEKAETDHQALLDRAYGGDDTVPWAAAMRAERLATQAWAHLEACRDALGVAETGLETARRADQLAQAVAPVLPGGKLGKEIRAAWPAYRSAVSAASSATIELRHKAPVGRSGPNVDDPAGWAAQQSLNRNSGCWSKAEAAEEAKRVAGLINAAADARGRFREAAQAYNAGITAAIELLRTQGDTGALIGSGRTGFRHDGDTVLYCDLEAAQTVNTDRGLDKAAELHRAAIVKMRDQEPTPLPGGPFFKRRKPKPAAQVGFPAAAAG